MENLARAWDYALEDVSERHIPELFHRAIKIKRDSRPLSAIDLLREWDGLKAELVRQGQEHAASADRQLMAGHGSLGRMTLDEWKTRHNLPAAWQLGQEFPPESDLYGKPVPSREPVPRCPVCGDAGFLVDRTDPEHPKLVRCIHVWSAL